MNERIKNTKNKIMILNNRNSIIYYNYNIYSSLIKLFKDLLNAKYFSRIIIHRQSDKSLNIKRF